MLGKKKKKTHKTLEFHKTQILTSIFTFYLKNKREDYLRLGDGPEGVKWAKSGAVVVGVATSTCFLERFRPRCTCRSQYFWPATTSLPHRHFFPSVLRHLPGSGSTINLPQYPVSIAAKRRKKTKKSNERLLEDPTYQIPQMKLLQYIILDDWKW